jgi:hypothetical protein
MTKAQEILKELDLDFEVIMKDEAFKITPMDFLSKIKIILVIEHTHLYHMFIWRDGAIQKECTFNEVGNITDVYSFLYNYDKKNLNNKKTI